MSQLNFDATQVSPESQFNPVPNGDYPVVITDSEMKTTNDGTGQYLQLTLEIIEGHYKGRKVWDRLNLVNKNTTAVEIAQRALSQICHAVQVLKVDDSAQLHGKPLVAKLAVRPASGGYDESNDVKEYKAMPGAQVQQPAQALVAPADDAPFAPPPAVAPASNKPAWA